MSNMQHQSSGLEKLRYSDFERKEELGSGSFGSVQRWIIKQSKEEVAVKKIKITGESRFKNVKSFNREISSLKALGQHSNIVTFISEFINWNSVFIVLELCTSSLGKFLKKHPKGLEMNAAKKIIYELLSAVHHCTENLIIHRDINVENVLLSSNGTAKLADFGLSRNLHREGADNMTPSMGTLNFRAPEMILGLKTYGSGVDIWSCGCIYIQVVTGKKLFKAKTGADLLQLIFQLVGTPTETNWPSFEKEFGVLKWQKPCKAKDLSKTFDKFQNQDLAVKLANMMLTPCHVSRPSAQEILQCDYFGSNSN